MKLSRAKDSSPAGRECVALEPPAGPCTAYTHGHAGLPVYHAGDIASGKQAGPNRAVDPRLVRCAWLLDGIGLVAIY